MTPPEELRVPLISRVEEGELVPIPTLPVLVMMNLLIPEAEAVKMLEESRLLTIKAVFPLPWASMVV